MTDNHEPLTEADLQAIQERHGNASVGVMTSWTAESLADVPRLLAEVRRLKRASDRLWAENVKLAAGWASVDTTKLADITDLDDCKRRLQRERERSHGAIRELCDLANTPAGAYKERLDAANAELAKLRAENQSLQVEVYRLQGIEHHFEIVHGYRRCDIPACNCGKWHGGHASERLREIGEELGFGDGRGTLLEKVQRLRAVAEAAEVVRTASFSRAGLHDQTVYQCKEREFEDMLLALAALGGDDA